MAHEIETAMFVGQGAWHGLGTVVREAPSISEAIDLAGLNWQVLEAPVYAFVGDNFVRDTDHKAIVRNTDKKVLGVTTPAYTPVQNSEAFRFFDKVIESGAATVEAAGSLRGGKRIWVLCKMTGLEAEVGAGDPVIAYLLFATGHDGGFAVRIGFTPVRVVCANTLRVAVGDTEAFFKLRHSAKVEEAIEIVKEGLDAVSRSFTFSMTQYRALRATKCSDQDFRKYVKQVLRLPEYDEEKKGARTMEAVQAAYFTGAGHDLPGVTGSYWGAFNAITHWTDYARGRSAEGRLDSTWFGSSAAIKDRALNVALGYVQGENVTVQ